MSETYTFPPEGVTVEGQGSWSKPRTRHKCDECEPTATVDARVLWLNYRTYGVFDTAADASACATALTSLYAGTSPESLGDDSPGRQEFYVNDTGVYGDPDEMTGDRPYTPGAEVSDTYSGPGFSTAGGEENGEFALDPGVDDTYAYIGMYVKQAVRFRVYLDPAWREIDTGNGMKVEYRIDTRHWEQDGSGLWSPSGDWEEGSTVVVDIPEPAVGADTAVSSTWVLIEGSAGVQKKFVITKAYYAKECLHD